MTYAEIRKMIDSPKSPSHTKHMQTVDYGRFTVMMSEKAPAILLDQDIAEKVKNRRWCIDSGGYPITNCNRTLIRLFDYVMAQSFDDKPVGCYVDHINHDKLDNRRQNLRFVTPQESSKNIPIRSNNKSGYIGVCEQMYSNGTIAYRAYITVDKKRIELGTYKSLEDAAEARRIAEDLYGFDTRPKDIKRKCYSKVNV